MEHVSAEIHEQIKEDFTIELNEVETKNKAYREFITWLAKTIDTTQETEAIKARIKTLIAKEEKLTNIKDNRPYTRHPLEGVGKLIKDTIKLINDKLKKNETPRLDKFSKSKPRNVSDGPVVHNSNR